MLTLFAIGTFWFWLLLAVEFIALIAFIEYERVGWATVSLVATLCALYFLGDLNIFAYAAEHPVRVAGGIGGYFVAGTMWAVVKWWFFVRRVRDKYDDLKAEFLQRKGVEGKVVPEEHRKEWKESVERHSSYSSRGDRYSFRNGVVPKPGDHKGRILTWMTYWPWSMLWTLIDDPVRRLFRAIYQQIQGMLEGISKSAFKGVDEDFREPPATPPEGGAAQLEEQLDGETGDGRRRPRGVHGTVS